MLKDEVTSVRRSFTEATTDDELVLMMHKQMAHGPNHIAAKQELAARHEAREQARHREIEARLDDLKIPHWTGRYTFGFAVAAVIIALGAWFFPRAPVAQTSLPPSGSDRAPLLPSPQPLRITAPVLPVAPPPQKQASAAIPPTQPMPPATPVPAIQDPKALPTPPK
jgi:hypothetical protein